MFTTRFYLSDIGKYFTPHCHPINICAIEDKYLFLTQNIHEQSNVISHALDYELDIVVDRVSHNHYQLARPGFLHHGSGLMET